MAMQVGGQSALAHKLSLIMALRMYVNVVMIFWYLLQIFAANSSRRSN
jgi:FtsH-binding integral membrane protein